MGDQTSLYIVRAIGGDQDGVAWLITHFRGFVEAQVRLRLRGHGTPHDVEDLAADVWVVALQRLADLRPRDGRHAPVLMRFLGTTALGTCNNFLRSRARNALRTGPAKAGDPPPEIDEIAAATRSLVSRVLLKETGSAVDAALRSLPDDRRDVLVLRLMEHRDNREIAQLLGIPPNTVAVRYRRALEALRDALPEALYGEIRTATRRPA